MYFPSDLATRNILNDVRGALIHVSKAGDDFIIHHFGGNVKDFDLYPPCGGGQKSAGRLGH